MNSISQLFSLMQFLFGQFYGGISSLGTLVVVDTLFKFDTQCTVLRHSSCVVTKILRKIYTNWTYGSFLGSLLRCKSP